MQRLPALLLSTITFALALLLTGCIPMNTAMTATPTPTPGTDDETGNSFVFTTNSGSDNVSAFANDITGKLTPVNGSPFSSPGSPWGIAASPDNKFLYVSSLQNAAVTGFSINSTTGMLTPLNCAAAPTGTQPTKIAITPAGSFLYTSNQAGNISGFSINTTTGCLTAVSTTATDSQARGLTVERGGKFLYVATGGGGINVFSIAANGTLTRLSAAGFDSGTGTMQSVKASPTTDILVATDAGTANTFNTLVINPSTGALTHIALSGGPAAPGAIAFNPAFNPTIPEIYIANSGSNTFTSTDVAPDGEVNFFTHIVSDSAGPMDLAVDPAGKFVYVANNGSNNIGVFTAIINGNNFNSAQISTAPAGMAPQSIAAVGHP